MSGYVYCACRDCFEITMESVSCASGDFVYDPARGDICKACGRAFSTLRAFNTHTRAARKRIPGTMCDDCEKAGCSANHDRDCARRPDADDEVQS